MRLLAVLATTITIGFGLITVLGLLVGDGLGLLSLIVEAFYVRELTSIFLQLVTITVAITIFPIGILNLLFVHTGRVIGRQRGALYSVVLILSFALVIVTYIVQRPASMVLLESVQVAIESALAGLLLFALIYGAATVMRRRNSWAGGLFVVVVLVILIGALPFTQLEAFTGVQAWLLAVPVNAGARGILLGIALATVVTGVRVLIGQDRSYRE